MGTCAPSRPNDDVEEMDAAADQPNSERITKIINDYQGENEKLRTELEEIKNQQDSIKRQDKAKQNEDVIRELEKMKALVVRGRVEAALLTKANSLLSETKTRVCIKGSLKHQQSEKNTWVEIHLTEGEIVEDDFKDGYVTLMHADSRDAETSKKCRILGITYGESDKEKVHYFLVSVVGSETELVFVCETEEQRNKWVKCITDALKEVSEPPENMIEVFNLKLEFSKKKLGIRVEEDFVETMEIDLKQEEADKPANEGAEKKVDDSKTEEVQNTNATTKDSSSEEEERPCQLIVTKITDQDLIDGGLMINCAVTAINDTSLNGMGYSQQLELLKTTPKPFMLSFTGEKIRREQTNENTGYSSILKELVADDENSVKSAFYELVKGTPFERELQSSDDKVTTIKNLLGNQRRLKALIHNFQGNQDDL